MVNTPTPQPGPSPTAPSGQPSDAPTILVNGQWVPAGHYVNGKWVRYTHQELENEAAAQSFQQVSSPKPKAKATPSAAPKPQPNPAPTPKATAKSKTSAGGYTTAASSTPKANDPFGAVGSLDTGLPDSGAGNIITKVPPSLHLSSRADDPTLNATSQTGDELIRQLYAMPPDQLKALQQKLVDAGSSQVTANGVADAATVNAYTNLLRTVQAYQTVNPQNPITPDELLNSLAKAHGAGKTINEKSTSTNLTDRITAQQTITQAFSSKLGRKPTDQEVAAFTSALNAYEQQNPTTTDTTLNTDASGLEKSRNTVTSGHSVDPSAYALQYINDNHGPEQTAANHLAWYQVALQALQGGAVDTGLTD